MKKVISLLLAVMMVMSMVAISGIVSASAETTVTEGSAEAIKNGEFTIIDPSRISDTDVVGNASTTGTGSGGVTTAGALSDLDSYIAMGGSADDKVYEYTTVSGARDGMLVDLKEPVQIAEVNNNLTNWKIEVLVWVDQDVAAGKLIGRTMGRVFNSNGSNIEGWTASNVGLPALTAGWNKVSVDLTSGSKGQNIDMAKAFAVEQHSGDVPGLHYAVAGYKYVPKTTTDVKEVTVISPYDTKKVEDMYQIEQNGTDEFSIADAASLSKEGDYFAYSPVKDAYLVNPVSTAAKAGGMIKVGGDAGIDVNDVLPEFLDGKLYADMWVYVENPNGTINPTFRMFYERSLAGGNYIEYNLCNNGKHRTHFNAGWNHISLKINPTESSNNYMNYTMQGFTQAGVVHYVAFYSHASDVSSDYAIGALRFTTAPSVGNFDVQVEGDHLYTEGEEFVAPVVKYQGQVVEATCSTPDMTVGNRKVVTLTFNGGMKHNFYYDVQAKGAVMFADDSNNGKVSNAGAKNKDNFVVGDYSLSYAPVASGGAGNGMYQVQLANPVNIRTQVLYANMYIDKAVLDNPSASEFLIELGSGTSYNNNAVRILFNGATFETMRDNGTLKPGWNVVKFDLGFHEAAANSNYTDANKMQIIFSHSSNKKRWVDWSNIRYARIYRGKCAGVIMFNGLGFGWGTETNGEYSGDDFAAAVAAAKDGDVIKLNRPVTIDTPIVVNKAVTVDLNGNNIVSNGDMAFKVEGGNLSVIDTNIAYNHSISGGKVYPANKGTIYAKAAGADAFRVVGSEDPAAVGYSTLSIGEGVSVVADYGVTVSGIKQADGKQLAYGVTVNSAANFRTPGTWEYDGCAFYVQGLIQHDNGPVINITGGTFNETNLVDDTDLGYAFALSGRAIANISGGTFKGENVFGHAMGPNSATQSLALVTVTGGRFYNAAAAEEFLAEGYEMDNVFGVYTVAPARNETDEKVAPIVYTGNWTAIRNLKEATDKSIIRASKSGSTATFSFTGTSVAISAYTSATYGQMSVAIDGGAAQVVDLYTADTIYQNVVYSATVEEGTHEVVITVLNTKNSNAGAKGVYYVSIDAIKTDGALVDTAAKEFAPIDVTPVDGVAKVKVDVPFTYGQTGGEITAKATLGTVEVNGNEITYTAPANAVAADTVTYEVNGYTGTINVKAAAFTVEAEDVLKNFGTFKCWYMSNHVGAFTMDYDVMDSFTFTGSELTIIGYKSQTYAGFELYIDDEYVDYISEYDEGNVQGTYKVELGTYTLGQGEHTVTIVTGGKTLIDAFKVA